MKRRHYDGGRGKSLCGYEFSRGELQRAKQRSSTGRDVNCFHCKRLFAMTGEVYQRGQGNV